LAPSEDGRAKRRREDDAEAASSALTLDEKAPPKRVRISDKVAGSSSKMDPSYEHEKLYLPRFVPPFPAQRDGARTVLEAPPSATAATGTADVTAAAASVPGRDDDTEPGLRVRSALVSLHPEARGGIGYDSGSAWDGVTARTPLLSVPWGRPTGDGGTISSGGGGSAGSSSSAVPSPSAATAAAQIVPLGRASGSRVSRILEGSMDVP
jgi:hypothetical protein